jgi:hypothetical protein
VDEQTLHNTIAAIVQEDIINPVARFYAGDAQEKDAMAQVQQGMIKLAAMHNAHETFWRVNQFHAVTGVPRRGGLMDDEQIDLRIRLIKEELKELTDGIKKWRETYGVDELIEIADALGDLDYVVNGAMIAFGLPGVAIAKEIHRSNMTKLLQNGNPLLREDGKVLKGPDYEPPNLLAILEQAGIFQTTKDEETGDLLEVSFNKESTVYPAKENHGQEDRASTEV